MLFDKEVNRKGTYCTQWDFVEDRFGRSDLLPFTISDTDFEIPIEVKNALLNRLDHAVFGYTRWKHLDFESAIQGWYSRRFDVIICESHLVYSPSVIFSVSLLVNLLSKEGDNVIIQTPAYDAFYNVIVENNRNILENPLKYENENYSIDWSDLEYKLSISSTKILLLCSPHNPTGRVWTVEELTKIVELCNEYGVFIISDEIHMDIVSKGFTHHPIIEYSTDNIALLTSGSKTFNFPGLVFSYGIIPNKEIREKFLDALKKKYGLSSTSTMGLIATMTAYNESETWVNKLNEYLDSNRIFVREYLNKYLPSFTIVKSEATYLMWIDISKSNYSLEELQDKLINVAGLAIMSGKIYGGNGGNFIRLNIGCPISKLKVALEKMAKALSGFNKTNI